MRPSTATDETAAVTTESRIVLGAVVRSVGLMIALGGTGIAGFQIPLPRTCRPAVTDEEER